MELISHKASLWMGGETSRDIIEKDGQSWGAMGRAPD